MKSMRRPTVRCQSARARPAPVRGFHSSTSQLNLRRSLVCSTVLHWNRPISVNHLAYPQKGAYVELRSGREEAPGFGMRGAPSRQGCGGGGCGAAAAAVAAAAEMEYMNGARAGSEHGQGDVYNAPKLASVYVYPCLFR